jgi:hypothetical protein
MSWLDDQLAKIPAGWVNTPTMTNLRSFAVGMSDPVMDYVQSGANLLPASTGIAQQVQRAIDQQNQSLAAERGPHAGYDYARTIGSAGSPANMVGAAIGQRAVAPVVSAAIGGQYSQAQIAMLAKLLSAGAGSSTGPISRSGHGVTNSPQFPGSPDE